MVEAGPELNLQVYAMAAEKETLSTVMFADENWNCCSCFAIKTSQYIEEDRAKGSTEKLGLIPGQTIIEAYSV